MKFDTRSFALNVFSFLLILCLMLLHVYTGELILTGDEPRYLYVSVSIWEANNLILPLSDWVQWQLTHSLPGNIPADRGIHSVIHSALISPLVGLGGLAAGRWGQFAVGVFPLLVVLAKYPNLLKIDALLWVSIYAISLPFFPYLRLLYPEIWLFCLLSLVLIGLSGTKLTKRGAWILFALIISMPFFHVRMSLVALALGAVLLYRVFKESFFSRAELILLTIICLTSFILFILYNKFLAGSGFSASAPFSPAIDVFFERLAVQLLSFRHGVILYSPVVIVGVSGLIIGAVKKNFYVTLCGLILFLYLVTFVWGAASESYTARFWVAILPTLIIGSVFWWRSVGNIWRWIIALPLIFINIVNSALFVAKHYLFLENRFGSVSYDELYYIFGSKLHLGLIALTDPFDFAVAGIDKDHSNLLALSVLLIFILLAAFLGIYKRYSNLFGIALTSLFIYLLNSCLLIQYEAHQYTSEIGVDGQGQTFMRFKFNDEQYVRGIKIGKYRDALLWGIQDEFPKSFLITGIESTGNVTLSSTTPGRQLLKFEQQKMKEIVITAIGQNASSKWAHFDIKLF